MFFTNYDSNKGRAISDNPNVCASFFWPPLERQVIFKGIAKRLTTIIQILTLVQGHIKVRSAAIVSKQSDVIYSYEELTDRYNKLLNENKDSILKDPAIGEG